MASGGSGGSGRSSSGGRPGTGLYLPSLLLLAVTAGLVLHGVATLVRTGQLGRALASGQNELAGPVVVGFVALIVACERLFPAVPRPLAARGQLHDACFFAVFVVVAVPFTTLLGTGISSLVLADAPWLSVRSSAALPGWVAIGTALVLMDGCNWLTHVADHRLTVLWRVHAVHHSQEELSVLTTFRVHPLVHTASTFAATLPVVVLTGYHPMTPAFITGYLVLGALPHANVRWSFGPLGKIFVSPAYHRLHHRIEGPQGINLGIVLSVWDVMARRALFPAGVGSPCRTGLPGRPLEVEQGGVGYRPLRLLAAQLLEPFTSVSRSLAAAAPSPGRVASTAVPGTRLGTWSGGWSDGWSGGWTAPADLVAGRSVGAPGPGDDQAALVGQDDELRPGPCAQLGQDAAHVRLRRERAQVQLAGDLVVGKAGGHRRQHLALGQGPQALAGARRELGTGRHEGDAGSYCRPMQHWSYEATRWTQMSWTNRPTRTLTSTATTESRSLPR